MKNCAMKLGDLLKYARDLYVDLINTYWKEFKLSNEYKAAAPDEKEFIGAVIDTIDHVLPDVNKMYDKCIENCIGDCKGIVAAIVKSNTNEGCVS